MIEIPESHTIARQVRESLIGRRITGIFHATHPHKFVWHTGDPQRYGEVLNGRCICSAEGRGAFVDIVLEDDVRLSLSDGVNLRLSSRERLFPRNIR